MDKNIVALVREDTKTVKVRFFPDVIVQNSKGDCLVVDDSDRYARRTAGKEYTYVTNLNCKAGDLALVLVGERPAVVEIQSVDDCVDIKPGYDREYKYLVAIIDTSGYERLTEQNKKLEALLRKEYQSNVRRQFREFFLANSDKSLLTAMDEILK